jgi:succinate dehydrogenase / fumarate reductase, cytochrome b subunit
MLGPYYRLQLTSVLSLTHRLTGIVLSLVGAPLLLWWIASTSRGAESYQAMAHCLSGWTGNLLSVVMAFSLSFHFFNGIRHLVWDTGKMLDLKDAYTSGWLVVACSLVATVILVGALP